MKILLKNTLLSLALALALIIFCLPSCSVDKNALSYGSACYAYLDAVPMEFGYLSDGLRGDIEITASVRNVSSNKRHSISLSEKNDYQQIYPLIPGKYDVSYISVSNSSLTLLKAKCDVESLEIKVGETVELPIYFDGLKLFGSMIRNGIPADGFAETGVFSRKVQYDGKIYDLDSIRKNMKFPKKDERIAPAEYAYIPSESHAGIVLILQNQTSSFITVEEATYAGVRFTNLYAVFPKGVAVGSDLRAIAHAKGGALGTPDYFLGSPMFGLGGDKIEMVYLDRVSGDRIKLLANPGDTYISRIDYEFAKYE